MEFYQVSCMSAVIARPTSSMSFCCFRRPVALRTRRRLADAR